MESLLYNFGMSVNRALRQRELSGRLIKYISMEGEIPSLCCVITITFLCLFVLFTSANTVAANSLKEKAEFRVVTASELLHALAKAEPGQIVYILDFAKIDLSDYENIRIPEGVTLASGRNLNGQEGALIFTKTLKTIPLFKVDGENVRITGIRIKGPDSTRRTKQMKELFNRGIFYSLPNSRGIQVSHRSVTIDNCELWGWTHAAIALLDGAGDIQIQGNYIHHNQREGLGYGIVLDKANAVISNNIFDWNRHSISASGRPGTSYIAHNNIIRQNANSHAFDMHGGRDRNESLNTAGTQITVNNNTFLLVEYPAIVIRGRPEKKSYITHNCFSNRKIKDAVHQLHAKGNLFVDSNQIGNCN